MRLLSLNTKADTYDDDFRELYEHAPCGYLLIQEDGLIVKANETFLGWTGYSRENLINKRRIQDFLPIPGKIYYETHFSPLLKMQEAVSEIAFELLSEGKPARPVLVTSILRQAKDQELQDDKPKHYRTTIFDATARRHYELELLRQKRKLEELNDEKNELLGMAAHELRTPLGVISTYSEFLEDEASPQLSQEHRDFISLIRSTSDNMLRLINDILDVSQIDAGKLHLDLQETDFKLFVEQTVAINRRLADKKQIREVFQAATTPPKLWLDQNKIAQVLDNLLINAIKFSSPETQISISLSHDQENVILRVADQGQGIPPEDLEKIFKPFNISQIKSTHGEPSTGLGLAIVRRIVEGHGGRVTVQSQLDKGTEFRIQLPLSSV